MLVFISIVLTNRKNYLLHYYFSIGINSLVCFQKLTESSCIFNALNNFTNCFKLLFKTYVSRRTVGSLRLFLWVVKQSKFTTKTYILFYLFKKITYNI